MKAIRTLLYVSLFLLFNGLYSQNYDNRYKSDIRPHYWQQHVVYNMDIDMDIETYRYIGKQKLIYTNNSPDTLNQVFYHLYPNAFQPSSEMNARLKNMADPDKRMVNNIGTKDSPVYESRISNLNENEIGFIKIDNLSQNGEAVDYEVVGTVLEVQLNQSIYPGEKEEFYMEFNAQVPVQIRRSGRNNKEGVALSMSQWYPKLAEYDYDGWHADPYIAREFYAPWGDFNVNITIDKNYTVGGTGYLQNANEIGHGYEDEGARINHSNKDKLTWRFVAPNVHDFSWSADPDYIHDKLQIPDGPMLHFLYKNDDEIKENWKNLQPQAEEIMNYFSSTIGKYPYKQYSILQAGDGGMEYAMCTFITGKRKFGSLLGVTIHEIAHTWFQFLLANNELKHGWMDEGFANYFSSYALSFLNNTEPDNPSKGNIVNYLKVVNLGIEEPLTTHADHFAFNSAYTVYNKGATFLSQLRYIIGEESFNIIIREYFKHWSFKHPGPSDFIRIAEKISGIQLDWYVNDWIGTTRTIDFAISKVQGNTIEIVRLGQIPMPMDLEVFYKDGSKESFYIPLREMRGEKPTTATVLEDWTWAFPTYSFNVTKPIEQITIDPKGFLADTNRENNTFKAIN